MSEPSAPDPDDGLGLALAQRVRAREAAELEARAGEWEAVLGGELELDEAIEQQREAGADDDELERAAAYFAPFDAGETAALVDGLLGQAGAADEGANRQDTKVLPFKSKARDDDRVEDTQAETADADADQPSASATDKPSSPAHDPGKSSFWWIPGGMLAAAAAAIALWWVWPRDGQIGADDSGPTIAQRDPLPSFTLETDGGLRELRGDDDDAGQANDAEAVHRYRRDTPFDWVLRPEVSTEAQIGVEGFALVAGGSAGLPLDLDALTQIADSGAIRIAGEVRELGLEPGRYTIVLALGRPEALPDNAAAITEPGDTPGWQVQRIEIQIDD